MDVLPKLMEKYSSEPDVLQAVVSVLTFIPVAPFAEKVRISDNAGDKRATAALTVMGAVLDCAPHLQIAALNAVTTALRKEMVNKTQPAFLRVTAGALAALVNDPQLKLKGQADLHQLGQELLKQLDHRLSELEVRRL